MSESTVIQQILAVLGTRPGVRVGIGDVGGISGVRDRDGDAGVDRESEHSLRGDRAEADIWSREPLRGDGAELDDG